MESEIVILGGGKTAYNLYKTLIKLNINPICYNFLGEYMRKKNIGLSFENEWQGLNSFSKESKIIITSETVFSFLPEEDRVQFKQEYFLRDKLNLAEIAPRINLHSIKEIDVLSDELVFPIAVKPKESAGKKVNFKFKVINNKSELDELSSVFEHCLFQPYLDPKKFKQIAFAGYFTGDSNSLIVVQQLNQYPIGVSSYVELTNQYNKYLDEISSFLNEINYKGFIELECKVSKEGEIFLLDINPRTWGWFYFYLSGVLNFDEVILKEAKPQLEIKSGWVNLPRLMMSNLQGRIVNPSIIDVILNKLVYEPYF